jgi:hypothetical protein
MEPFEMKKLYQEAWDKTLRDLEGMVEQERHSLKNGGFGEAQILEFAGRVAQRVESAWNENLQICLGEFQQDSPRS